MPDTANARLALRRLLANVIPHDRAPAPRHPDERTIDAILAELDTDEAADLQLVLDALADNETPRYAWVVLDRHPDSGGVLDCAVLDLVNAIGAHGSGEVEVYARMGSNQYAAQDLARHLVAHPIPVPDYDPNAEPF